MDLSKGVFYGGIGFSNQVPSLGSGILHGYQVNTIQFSDVTVQEYLQKRALQDGVFAADIYLAQRKVVIDSNVFGSSLGGAFDLLQTWTGVFNPRNAFNADPANFGFRPMQLWQATDNTAVWDRVHFPAGIPLQMYLRPMIPVHYEVLNNQGMNPRGHSMRLLTTMLARDPRRYLQSVQTISLPIASALFTSIAVTLPYRGDYPTWGTWNGTITSTLGTNWANYAVGGIVMNLSTYTGSLSLDFSQRLLVDGSGAQRNDLIVSGTGMSEVGPLNQSVTVGGLLNVNTGYGNFASTFTYREAFT